MIYQPLLGAHGEQVGGETQIQAGGNFAIIFPDIASDLLWIMQVPVLVPHVAEEITETKPRRVG